MPDSMTTRLRNIATNPLRDWGLTDSEIETLTHAADEIERLRVLVSGLTAHCQWLDEQLREAETL